MKLVWHIVRKDFRRLWLPLSLWLLLGLAQPGLLTTYLGDGLVESASYEGLRYFSTTTEMMVIGIGFVLAAWLVMEDSLVITTAFWSTRPISGARLLAAKVIGALLMFCVAPVLVLTPVWIAFGFSVGEWAHAAWDLAATQGQATIAAFVIAGVTATSGQFLVRAVGAMVLFLLVVFFLSGSMVTLPDPISTGVAWSQNWIKLVLLLITPIILVIHQYLTRRTGRTWVVAAVGLGLVMAIPFVWRWDISSLVQTGDNPPSAAEPAVSLLLGKAHIEPSPSSPLRRRFRVEGSIGDIPGDTYVRINGASGEWISGSGRLPFAGRFRVPLGADRPPNGRALRVSRILPADPEMTPVAWVLEGEDSVERAEVARAGGRELALTMNLSLMRGQEIGRLPLKVGAELRHGACLTKIISIERSNGYVYVRLDDHDFSPIESFGTTRPVSGLGLSSRRAGEDCFIASSLPEGEARLLTVRSVGEVQINSMLVGQRELLLEPPVAQVNGRTVEIPDWEQAAVIIQVRFSSEALFTRQMLVNTFSP